MTEGRPGPAKHSRTPGFPPIGPAVGGCRARSVTEGRPAFWCTGGTGRSFSGSEHGRCGHDRSLVPSTGGAWPGGGALRCCKRKKRRRRTEERREEKKKIAFSFAGVAKETKS